MLIIFSNHILSRSYSISREDFTHEWLRRPEKSFSLESFNPTLYNIDEGFECDISSSEHLKILPPVPISKIASVLNP